MNNRKTVIIVLLVVLILFATVGLVLGISVYKNNGGNNEKKGSEKYYITLDEMYCNIKDSKKIVKIKTTIEVDDKDTNEELEKKQFLMRNEVNKIIRSKEEEDLQGKEGHMGLQKEVKDSLVNLFDNESISNVYFDDLIIQ